jgi:exopolyphosphatase/guanosine-5'-triphosphate,3'-diphosphate pyrophosphatase
MIHGSSFIVHRSSSPRAAAIDVGSNSVKLVIGEMGEDGDLRILTERIRFSRLGAGLGVTGRLDQKGQGLTLAALAELLEEAEGQGVVGLRLVGTSALREASNGAQFLSRVRGDLGVELEILSEDEEARLSYLAVAFDPSLGAAQDHSCVVDIGGGSTELIWGEGLRVDFSRSVKLGAVRLTEQFLRSDPPDRSELAQAVRYAEGWLREASAGRRSSRLAGVGGTVVNLARIGKGVPAQRTEEIHGAVMSASECCRVLDLLSGVRLAERRKLIGLDPQRADITVAGAIILERVLSVLGAVDLLVSVRGLRHGVLHELLQTGS